MLLAKYDMYLKCWLLDPFINVILGKMISEIHDYGFGSASLIQKEKPNLENNCS